MVLQAKDIMDRNLLLVDEETDALSAARKMVAARKGYAVLTRGGGATIAGIVTEWDFLEKVVVAGIAPETIRVKEIGSSTVQSCLPETPTDEVASTMAQLGIRRIVVRSGDQVVGLVTARHVIGIFRQYIDKLTAQIAGYHVGSTPPG
ncbi:MAG TPA: CBS domain-containing protein [Thermoplasmata archaeon]|nr:CBS domain-containing protein [Thermoplasmata archaeon]